MLPVVVVHGGAGKVSAAIVEEKMVALRAAVDAGYSLLQRGGTSLDAVEAAVRVMEDHPAFNAGYGSSLTIEGSVEMDALIMEGTLMKAGAVGAVRTVRNPVSLARKVMEQTEHALLVGPWADDFAREMGIPPVANGSLVSEKAKQRLEELQCFHSTVYQSINVNHKEHDTVGAVAVDTAGHVACATSTGGLTGQRCGRVGDSPIVGAGGFADDSVCAVSTTGHGEAIARSCLAYDMAVRLQAGSSPTVAMEQALKRMRLKTQGGCAGAILVTPTGTVVTGTTTELMPWACRNKQGYQCGSERDEHPL
ncbi:hypothetical protein MRX96_024810 [Rhipicephalus microplus]|uniref:Putative asparaginase n=1 Tax=Rhipicephalus microplus TaxID=6941 RepID=A0A6M2CJK6_RHIMP